MKIRCPTCNLAVNSADINVATGISKCTSCNEIFNFSSQIPGYSCQGSKSRQAVVQPKRFTLERGIDGLTIIRPWLSAQAIGMTIFCLFWNGFMVVWFSIAISQKIYIMALFGSFHALIGLGILYGTIAAWFNKTYINIKQNSLTIKHKPFPAAKQFVLTKSDIKQLYTKENHHYTKSGHSIDYSLHAITRKEANIKLLSGLPSSEEALFLEQEIEKYLRIEDAPVGVELPR